MVISASFVIIDIPNEGEVHKVNSSWLWRLVIFGRYVNKTKLFKSLASMRKTCHYGGQVELQKPTLNYGQEKIFYLYYVICHLCDFYSIFLDHLSFKTHLLNARSRIGKAKQPNEILH
jgi:hypothetical protein